MARTSEQLTPAEVLAVSQLFPLDSGKYLTNDGTNLSWGAGGGSFAWGATASGTSGSGVGLTVGLNSSAATSGLSVSINGTQSNQTSGITIQTGSAPLVYGINFASILTTGSSSGYSRGIRFTTITDSTAGGAIGMEFNGDINGASSGSTTGYGIAFQNIKNGAGVGFAYGLYQNVVNSGSGGTGYGLYQATISGSSLGLGIGWRVENLHTTGSNGNGSKFFSLNNAQSFALTTNRLTDTAEILHSRTNTATTGTLADNFHIVNFKRTSVQNGAGGTFTSAGSVVKIENVATQTAGTLTDTVTPLLVVQSANSTGSAAYLSTAGTGKTAIKFDSGFTTATAPTGASTYIIIDIGGVAYKLLAQAS